MQHPRRFRAAFFAVALAVSSHPLLASDADALAISTNIQAKHLPFGTILDPIYAAPGSNQIAYYTRCGDSAIWTGHYLAAESFRYAVTSDPLALANINNAIAGIQGLIDVTGTDLLARCRFPASSPYAASLASQESANGIYSKATTGDQWVGNTSRDEYSGVFFGLAIAYDFVNDSGVKSSSAALITRMLNFLRANNWNVPIPGQALPSTTFLIRPDEELSFITIGAHVNPAAFANAPELNLGALILAPIAVDTLSNSSYFKFNLDAINLFNLVRLNDNSTNHAAWGTWWNYVESQQNAFFNMTARALENPGASRDQSTLQMLNLWLERPKRDPYVDLSSQFPSCGSGEACNPIPVNLRVPTDFLWQRDPFQLAGGGDGTIESAGIDYILPWWMARYYGMADSTSAVNAANPYTTAAAPVSIASIYGVNLATITGSAQSLPLPASIGGNQVTLTDSAGAQFAAPLFYVSPTQINFEVPSGVAPGTATLVAGNENTTLVISASAPGVFTLPNSTAAYQLVTVASGATFLSVYGTGFRGAPQGGVSATLNGTPATISYAGPQGTDEALDQVNIQIPPSLAGAGTVSLQLSVGIVNANAVTVSVP